MEEMHLEHWHLFGKSTNFFGRLLTEAKKASLRRTPDWRARFILAHAATF